MMHLMEMFHFFLFLKILIWDVMSFITDGEDFMIVSMWNWLKNQLNILMELILDDFRHTNQSLLI